MPCYDSRTDSSYVREEALREFRHNSPVAELLCEALTLLHAGRSGDCSPALHQWWVEHQARDANKQSISARSDK